MSTLTYHLTTGKYFKGQTSRIPSYLWGFSSTQLLMFDRATQPNPHLVSVHPCIHPSRSSCAPHLCGPTPLLPSFSPRALFLSHPYDATTQLCSTPAALQLGSTHLTWSFSLYPYWCSASIFWKAFFFNSLDSAVASLIFYSPHIIYTYVHV